MSLPDFFVAHKREVLTLTGEHLRLVGVSMLLAVAIGVPLGILLSRRPALKSLILGANNIMQTIPSLALFGLLLPVPWIGARAAAFTSNAAPWPFASGNKAGHRSGRSHGLPRPAFATRRLRTGAAN